MRKPIALSLGLAAALAVSACSAATSSGFALTPNNAVIRVTDTAMKMTIDRTTAPQGKVTFVVVNQDTVAHEVVILKTNKDPSKLALLYGASKIDEEAAGENVGEVEVEAGTTGAGTFELEPGKYVLVCNVVSHYMAGMYSAFEVKAVAGQPQTQAKPAATTEAKAPAQAPAAPGLSKELRVLNAVRPNLVQLVDAAQKGDFVTAQKALKAYNTAWNGVEVYVSYRAPDMYTEVEAVREAKVTELLGATPPNQADVLAAAQSVLAEYDLILAKVSAGAPISPLFDDVADLRILRANTLRDATPALKAGDAAAARSLLQSFITKWADVEDMVHERSDAAYSDIEAAMAKVNTAIQKPSPAAAELTPLVATLSDRFNYAVSLVNAAARGADVKKTTFSTDDVQAAAALAAINNELKASLGAWQSGKYDEAATHARNAAGPLFAKAQGALKAKNSADAAPLKALNVYADMAGKSGNAATVAASEKAAIEAVLVGQQWVVGQFWTDPKLKTAITAALPKE